MLHVTEEMLPNWIFYSSHTNATSNLLLHFEGNLYFVALASNLLDLCNFTNAYRYCKLLLVVYMWIVSVISAMYLYFFLNAENIPCILSKVF